MRAARAAAAAASGACAASSGGLPALVLEDSVTTCLSASLAPLVTTAKALWSRDIKVAYTMLLWVSEQSLHLLKREQSGASADGVRRAAVSLISSLETARAVMPALGDRAAAILAMRIICADDQESQARQLAWPSDPAPAASSDGAGSGGLLHLRLLHAANEHATHAVLVHQVLAQVQNEQGQAPDGSAASAAASTRAAIERDIARLEEEAALAVCLRAQAWLDGEVRGDEDGLLRELEQLELEATSGSAPAPAAASAVD